MQVRQFTVGTIPLACGAVAMLTVALFFPDWLQPLRQFLHLEKTEAKADAAKDKPADDDDRQQVRLNEVAARDSLDPQLAMVEKLVQATYLRTLAVPGVIVERPGNCAHVVTAPLAGVIKQIHATPHDRVAPGKPLFTVQIVSEPLQTAQANCYKTQRELELVTEYLKQLEDSATSSVIPRAKILELEQQIHRLTAAWEGLVHELKIRGLSQRWIRKVNRGVFLTEVTIVAPDPVKGHAAEHLHATANGGQTDTHQEDFFFEMEELKTLVGEHVQAGQALCHLADHKVLFIQGQIFATEVAALRKAAKDRLPIRAEFGRDAQAEDDWPSFLANLQLSFFDNKVDADTQTLTFFIRLPNEFVEHNSDGKTYRVWRFRLGQRVQLQVPVQQFTNVIVLPAEAMVREGAETYVFKARGPEVFERKPVHIVYEDTRVALIAADGELQPNWRIVTNGTAAAQLNWTLKTKQAAGEGDD